MSIIRKYYLGLFLIFLPTFLLSALLRKSPNSFGFNVLISVAGALAISILCGTLLYFQNTKWGPAKSKKMFLKSPFKELFENGFTREEDSAVGSLSGYTVIVVFTSPEGKSGIRTDVLFDIGLSSGPESDDYLKEIMKRNKPVNRWTDPRYEWTRNSVGCSFEYMFKPPGYQKLLKKAEQLIGILIAERLRPMSLAEALRIQKLVE